MNPLVVVENLSKAFHVAIRSSGIMGALKGLIKRNTRTLHALDAVSFKVNQGDLIGYIGPNGAGKSTTIKILSGILTPDAGKVQVFGRTPWQNRIETVRNIGVVFGQRTQLWWDLPVIESFDLLKHIYAIPEPLYRENKERMIALLDLQTFLGTPVRQLSLGQRMRCELAASLLHDPALLFLDEPTIGLDAVSKLAVRDFIRSINKEKKTTIILTTHDMDDIESLCNRVIVLNHGKIFLDGTLKQLRRLVTPERYLIVDLKNENDRIAIESVDLIKQEKHRIRMRFNPEHISAPELISTVMSRHEICDLFVENPPIEDVIAQLYTGGAR